MDNNFSLIECELRLLEKIGYRFGDESLFRESLTHTSYSNEHPAGDSPANERLEFLGDAVLDLVISCRVFRLFPGHAEGELTRIRAEVVNEKSLSDLARLLGIGSCLRLGKGEARGGGQEKDSILADALEALLGAIYIDGGLEPVRKVVEELFAEMVEVSATRKKMADHKTRLQELLQARHGHLPSYSMTSVEGPVHQRTYSAEVRFDGEAIGRGQGRTKKAAEQQAACSALEALEAPEA